MLSRDTLFRLTVEEASAPRPVLKDYKYFIYYCDDLACWKATQTERYLSGIRDEESRRVTPTTL